MDTQNLETCKYIELNGVQLCCFTNGNIYRIEENGDMKYIKGYKLPSNYLRASFNYKSYYLHRVVGYAFLNLDINNIKIEIDHINRIRDDNRVDNLRVVTHQHNNWNKDNIKGYCWDKRSNKWCVRIRIPNNIRKHIGLFENEVDAQNAYLEAKAKYHIIN